MNPEFTPNSPFSGHEPPLKSIWPCAGRGKGPSDRWPWKSGCWSFHPPNITATRRPFRHPANPHLLQPRGLISLVHHRQRGFAKTSPLCSSTCRPCPWVLAHLLPNVFAHLLLPSVLAHLLLPRVLAHLLFVVPLPTFFFLVSLPTFFFLVSLPTSFLVSLPTFFVLAHRVPEKYSWVGYFLKEVKPEAGKYHANFFNLLYQCSLSLNWHDDSVRAKPPNSLDMTAGVWQRNILEFMASMAGRKSSKLQLQKQSTQRHQKNKVKWKSLLLINLAANSSTQLLVQKVRCAVFQSFQPCLKAEANTTHSQPRPLES